MMEPAERLLARLVAPEVAAGCLLAFVFALSEHGVPELLTVKGKAWHTYSEGIFSLWTRRMVGTSHADLASPIIAAVPLLLVIAASLAIALALRTRATVGGDFRPLPVRRLGAARWPALLLPVVYLGCGVVLPVITMALWAAGSTQSIEPISLQRLAHSFGLALNEAGPDLGYTAAIGGMTVALLMAVAVPLARQSARRTRVVEWLTVLPIAVPAILLAIGLVGVFNRPATGDFYDSAAMVACAYAARFLPFAVLTLSHMVRRISRNTEEAALLTGRSATARALWIHLPPLVPAIWSASCLVFILALRELDVAVVMPAGNGTIVRRLSNIVHFGGEDMGGALALLLPEQLGLHLPADQRIEGAEGFVQEPKFGVDRQGPGDADALLLAARKLVRIGVFAALEADQLDHLLRLCPAFLERHILHPQGEGDVAEYRHMGKQAEVLKHHAHLLPPDRHQFLGRGVQKILAFQ